MAIFQLILLLFVDSDVQPDKLEMTGVKSRCVITGCFDLLYNMCICN